MPFARIEQALKTCEKHLDSIDQGDPNRPEIESYIVSSMVLLIVSEYEQLIEGLFVQRAEQSKDGAVANFVKTTIAQSFRSPDLGKINQTLKKFDQAYSDSFMGTVENTEFHAAWDNIMTARHAVVHKRGALNLTFLELSKTYPKTKRVLSQLKRALGVP